MSLRTTNKRKYNGQSNKLETPTLPFKKEHG